MTKVPILSIVLLASSLFACVGHLGDVGEPSVEVRDAGLFVTAESAPGVVRSVHLTGEVAAAVQQAIETDRSEEEIVAMLRAAVENEQYSAQSGSCTMAGDLNGHIQQNHVGKSDDELRARARRLGHNASSWRNYNTALSAVHRIVRNSCSAMLRWQVQAPLRATRTFSTNDAGVVGRSCSSRRCFDTRVGTVVYRKLFGAGSFQVSWIVTAYPHT
jgi:hypothetical protein